MKAYKLPNIAIYRGLKFKILKIESGLVLIYTMSGDYRDYEDLEMELVERGVYQKWVAMTDVELSDDED